MDGMAQNVLVIASDHATASSIGASLPEPAEHPFVSVGGRDLSSALARLAQGGIDAILLDPFLPDSQGIATFDQILAAARRIPILVVTDRGEEDIARQAVEHGAKDRVLKEHIDRYS